MNICHSLELDYTKIAPLIPFISRILNLYEETGKSENTEAAHKCYGFLLNNKMEFMKWEFSYTYHKYYVPYIQNIFIFKLLYLYLRVHQNDFAMK